MVTSILKIQLAIIWPSVVDHVYSISLQHHVSSRSDATSILRRQKKQIKIKRDTSGRQRSDRFPRFLTWIHTVKRDVCRLRNTSAQLWDVKESECLFSCVCFSEHWDTEMKSNFRSYWCRVPMRACVHCLPSFPWLPSLFSICTAPTYFFNWTFRTSFSLHKNTQLK